MRMLAFLLANLSSLLSLICYIPQIVHLHKVKDATGISLSSQWITLMALVAYVAYSLVVNDMILLMSMIPQGVAAAICVYQTYKYRPRK